MNIKQMAEDIERAAESATPYQAWCIRRIIPEIQYVFDKIRALSDNEAVKDILDDVQGRGAYAEKQKEEA